MLTNMDNVIVAALAMHKVVIVLALLSNQFCLATINSRQIQVPCLGGKESRRSKVLHHHIMCIRTGQILKENMIPLIVDWSSPSEEMAQRNSRGVPIAQHFLYRNWAFLETMPLEVLLNLF